MSRLRTRMGRRAKRKLCAGRRAYLAVAEEGLVPLQAVVLDEKDDEQDHKHLDREENRVLPESVEVTRYSHYERERDQRVEDERE